MSWNVQGSMRGDGVPVAPGMLDGEAVAAGVMMAEGAILGLFRRPACRTLRVWCTRRISGVTTGIMRTQGWMPRRRRRQRCAAGS